MELQDAVGIVTGGGTGIGRSVCHALARAGARVVIVNYSRSQQEAEATARELVELGCEGRAVRADVSVESDVRRMVDDATREFGRLDVLVNNAAITHYVPHADLDGLTEEVWDSILDVNLKGTFYCSRAAAPELRRRRGAIVNVASIAGLRGTGSSIAYAVSKAGVLQLTRGLAVALAPEVRVNAVAPGQVRTRFLRLRRGDRAIDEVEATMARTTPLQEVAEPEHVAEAVMGFIRSDFVTGEHLVVDGGKNITY
jgi:NAD(P)-dependent dehydrogenase (short-subunit alcohol dehydrogenase family)